VSYIKTDKILRSIFELVGSLGLIDVNQDIAGRITAERGKCFAKVEDLSVPKSIVTEEVFKDSRRVWVVELNWLKDITDPLISRYRMHAANP
jgi:hypothetical protein